MNEGTVIVADRPALATVLALALGANQLKNGWFTDGRRIVTWVYPGMVRLAEPSEMNPTWRQWRLKDLPLLPEDWPLEIPGNFTKQAGIVTHLLKNAEAMIAAPVPGAEGLRLFAWLRQCLGWLHLPMQRLWLPDLSEAGLRQALEHPLPWRDDALKVQALHTQAKVDWLIGVNLSRAYTLHHRTRCHVGRVQTAAMQWVGQHNSAVPQPETLDQGPFRPLWITRFGPFALVDAQGVSKTFPEWAAAETTGTALGTLIRIGETTTQQTLCPAPRCFDTYSLLEAACGLVAERAQDVLHQATVLYEKGFISLPFTSTRTMPQAQAARWHALAEQAPGLGFGVQAPLRTLPDELLGSIADGCHAILPTKARRPEHDDLLPLWRLIWLRFLAQFSEPGIDEERLITGSIEGQTLHCRQRLIRQQGWRETSRPGGALQEVSLASQETQLVAGTLLQADTILVESKGHQPQPIREPQLIRALADQAEPQHAAAVIAQLLRLGVCHSTGGHLGLTQPGHALLQGLDTSLRDPQTLDRWTQPCQAIARGKATPNQVLAEAQQKVADQVHKATQQPRLTMPTIGGCPRCGQLVEARLVSYACPGCDLVIGKHLLGHEVTVPEACTLLAGGRVGPVLLERNGQPFIADLVLQDGVAISQTSLDGDLGSCPACGDGHITVQHQVFQCSQRHCPFLLWRRVNGHTFTIPQVRQLLNGETLGPFNFQTNGQTTQATITLDPSSFCIRLV